MSVKIMGLVWDMDLPPNEKLVLLAYADHANHDGGSVFPAVESIAKKTSYSEREVQRITHALEEKGFLIADGKGPKGTNKWRIGGDILSPVKLSGVTNETPRGDIHTARGVTPMSPESSRTIKEPSEESGIKIFTDAFGRFYGERERKRWSILVDAIGKDHIEQIVSWALKKEINLINRPSLLDSLETAAKKWQIPFDAGKPRDFIKERYGGIIDWSKEMKNDNSTGMGNTNGKNGSGLPQLEA